MGSDRFLEREVGELMSLGVICIAEEASLLEVQRAMLARSVHAVLVVGTEGTPLGWVTSRDLLGFVDRDLSLTLTRASDVIVEPPTTISPSASAREALDALSQPGVTHLLVARAPDRWPVGVLADVDLGLALR